MRCLALTRRTINPSIRYYLSERFRLRFEDIDFDVLNDTGESQQHQKSKGDVVDTEGNQDDADDCCDTNGESAADEIAQDAQNYKDLMAKIDGLLEKLQLDAWLE